MWMKRKIMIKWKKYWIGAFMDIIAWFFFLNRWWSVWEHYIFFCDPSLTTENLLLCLLKLRPYKKKGMCWDEDLHSKFGKSIGFTIGHGLKGIRSISLLVKAQTSYAFIQLEQDYCFSVPYSVHHSPLGPSRDCSMGR